MPKSMIESDGGPDFGSNDYYDQQVSEVERAAKVFDTVSGMRVGSSLKVAGEVYKVTTSAKGMGDGKKWLQIGDETGHQFVMVMPYDQSYVTLHSPGRTPTEPTVVPVQQIEWLADEVEAPKVTESTDIVFEGVEIDLDDGMKLVVSESELMDEGLVKKIVGKIKDKVSPKRKALLKKLKSDPDVKNPEALATYIGKRLGGLSQEDVDSIVSSVSESEDGGYTIEGVEGSFRTFEGAINVARRIQEGVYDTHLKKETGYTAKQVSSHIKKALRVLGKVTEKKAEGTLPRQWDTGFYGVYSILGKNGEEVSLAATLHYDSREEHGSGNIAVDASYGGVIATKRAAGNVLMVADSLLRDAVAHLKPTLGTKKKSA